MSLTPEEIKDNLDLHYRIIDKYVSEDRKSKILNMIKEIGEEDYALCPASGTNWYHGCYPGGYIQHVNIVVEMALRLYSIYEKMGGTLDFTVEELVFTSLFHDLGKIGNGHQANYIPNKSEWHVKNQGKVYVSNPELDFMLIPDRSLYILQSYGIKLSQKEYLAIKLHDGLFEETNKPYYISNSPDSRLKSNIVPILHTADYLASKIEFDKEHTLNQEAV